MQQIRILEATPDVSPADAAHFFAFGEQDDPVRLTLLMAKHLAGLFPQDRSIKASVQTCMDPRQSWKDRHDALWEALKIAASHPPRATPFMVLVDIDALVPEGEDGWNDDRSASARKQFFNGVVGAMAHGGWLVLRTCPSQRVTTLLQQELGFTTEVASETAENALSAEVKRYAPEVRPIANWLLTKGQFRPRDLSRITEQVEDFNAYLIDRGFEFLSRNAADTGKFLACVRPPQKDNGHLGPFGYADAPPNAESLPSSAVSELFDMGFLQRADDISMRRIPRLVRMLFHALTGPSTASELAKLHLRLGSQSMQAAPLSEEIEIHHHAVLTGDIELAKKTVRYDGTALRTLAKQLSLKAHQQKNREIFKQAADLFAHVVQNFDPTDAYAWEYWGYNLARTLDRAHDGTILKAYRQAHNLWPANPLYHGRLLGFRGERGERVLEDVVNGIDKYTRDAGDAVSFFVEAVFNGLRRGSQQVQIDEITRQRQVNIDRFVRKLAPVEVDDDTAL